MAVLLFSSDRRGEERRLREILVALGHDVEVHRSLERLYMRFQQPRGDICLMVFVVGNRTVLNHLLLMKEQMYDLPVVLVLAGADRETMKEAHRFYPRLIAFTGSDRAELSTALQNIILRECRGSGTGGTEVMRMDAAGTRAFLQAPAFAGKRQTGASRRRAGPSCVTEAAPTPDVGIMTEGR